MEYLLDASNSSYDFDCLVFWNVFEMFLLHIVPDRETTFRF
nr:MAG TPA: hypothetical protein [Caudoviricetes sp.]